jgi:hypothetical protein
MARQLYSYCWLPTKSYKTKSTVARMPSIQAQLKDCLKPVATKIDNLNPVYIVAAYKIQGLTD